jgi:hypothetical protein
LRDARQFTTKPGRFAPFQLQQMNVLVREIERTIDETPVGGYGELPMYVNLSMPHQVKKSVFVCRTKVS